MRRTARLIAAFFTIAAGQAAAQNTGGVFPPVVNEGASALEFRTGYRPQDGENGLANRLHYQRAVSGDLMWRIVGQVSGTTNDQDFEYLQGELFWDLSDDDDRWRTGFRFDATLRDGSAPEQLAANWTNQVRLTERWTGRFVLLNKVQIGDRAPDGIAFETRANLFTRLESGVTVGVESYNLHGSTEDLDPFGGRQQIGPFAVWPVAEGWGVFTGVLIGANDQSPDADYRLWLTRNF